MSLILACDIFQFLPRFHSKIVSVGDLSILFVRGSEANRIIWRKDLLRLYYKSFHPLRTLLTFDKDSIVASGPKNSIPVKQTPEGGFGSVTRTLRG